MKRLLLYFLAIAILLLLFLTCNKQQEVLTFLPQQQIGGGISGGVRSVDNQFEGQQVCITTLSGRRVNGVVLLPENYKKDTVFLGKNGVTYTDSISSFDYGDCGSVQCPKIIGAKTKYIPSEKLWTLLSKCEINGTNQCDLNNQFNGIIQVGDVPQDNTNVHPEGANAGQGIGNWNVYTLCSDSKPTNDGNGHYWIEGSPDDYSTFSFIRSSADSPCVEECKEVIELLSQDCEGALLCEYFEKLKGDLIPIKPDTVVSVCNQVSNQDFEIKEVCVLSEDNENGIIGQRWDSEGNAAAHDVTGNIFHAWNTHINGAPDEEVVITNNWSLNDLDFPLTGAYQAGVDVDISSQELYYAYIYVDQDMILRDQNQNNGEQIKAFLQDCNKEMLPIAQTTANTGGGATAYLGDFKEICKGFYKVAFQVSDYSTYGGIFLRYSIDGGATYINFPMSQTFTSPPKTETVKLYCYADGTTTLPDGSAFLGTIVDCDPTCYPISREPLPDVEVNLIQACDDVTGDPADFVTFTLEVVTTNGEQTITNWTNYGDDNTQNEYTIQGTPVNCATGVPIEAPVVIPVCDDVEFLTAYAPSGEKGVNVERWNTNAITGGSSSDVPSDYFVGPADYSGMPAHDNGVPDGPIIVETDLLVLDQNNAEDQLRYWTWLYTTEPIRLRELFNRAEAVDYYLGECCVSPTLNSTGEYFNNVASGSSFDVTLEAGIHYIGGEIYDFSGYSGVDYQYSTDDGTTWKRVPESWLYSKKPTIEECTVKACIDADGDFDLTDAETGELLGSEFTLKKPQLCSGGIAVQSEPQCESQNYYIIEGENGTTHQSWTTSAVTHSTATGHEYILGFTGTDSEGYPSHANAADTTVTHTAANTININNGAIDQAQNDFYLYLPLGYNLREWTQQADAVGVWASDCSGGEMTEILNAPYTNGLPNDLGYFDRGIYRFRLYMTDVTVNGSANIQYQDNAGVWRNIPADWIFIDKPKEIINKGWFCDNGTLYNKDKSEVIDETKISVSCEPIQCSTTQSSASTGTSEFVCDCTGSNEIAYIDGTNTVTLTGGSFCSYSITVDRGSVNVVENGITSPYSWTAGMSEGDSNQDGCKYLQNNVVITGTSGNARARISILR